MITARQEEKLLNEVKSLSELELSSFLEAINEYLHNNKMHHLNDSGIIAELEERIAELENDLDIANRKLSEISNII